MHLFKNIIAALSIGMILGCNPGPSEIKLIRRQEVAGPVPTGEHIDPVGTISGINKPLDFFCDNKYSINHGIVPVCSQEGIDLDQTKLDHVEDQLLKSLYLYQRWIGNHGYDRKPKGRRGLVIYFVTYETINNEKWFPRKDHKKIVGRYTDSGKQRLYVTDRVFEKEGYTDFVHEVAHWFNEELGINADESEDEAIAYSFESHYKYRTLSYEYKDFLKEFGQ